MNNRLTYFDVLKGIAIFMVVVGHVITMCIREIDRTPLFKFVAEIHMPLFFFISGWFMFRTDKAGALRAPSLGRRALQLLVPMAVVSSIWVVYFPCSGLQTPLDSTFTGLWSNSWKNGYWFTLCLFEIIVVYALFFPLFKRYRSAGFRSLISVLVWFVLLWICFVTKGSYVSQWLGIDALATYWPAFMAGVIASSRSDKFNRMVSNLWCTTTSLLVGAALLYYICWWWEFPAVEVFKGNEFNLVVLRPVFHICLAFVAVAVFRPWVNGVPNARWVRLWAYLGVNSLGIYLLHYFFLFPMGCFRDFAVGLNLAFVPMLVIASLAAIFVTAVTLGIMRVVSISPILNFLLTGSFPKKNAPKP